MVFAKTPVHGAGVKNHSETCLDVYTKLFGVNY